MASKWVLLRHKDATGGTHHHLHWSDGYQTLMTKFKGWMEAQIAAERKAAQLGVTQFKIDTGKNRKVRFISGMPKNPFKVR